MGGQVLCTLALTNLSGPQRPPPPLLFGTHEGDSRSGKVGNPSGKKEAQSRLEEEM